MNNKINIKFIGKFYITLAWAFLIFTALTYPTREYLNPTPTYYDKLAHFLLFGIFSFLIVWTIYQLANFKFNKAAIIAIIIATIYSAFGEYIQHFVPGRTVSSLDFISGSLGGIFFVILAKYMFTTRKPKLLLHICCIGCGVYVSQELRNKYEVVLYFFNPNIFPENEYKKRLEEIKKVANAEKFKIIIDEYNHKTWRKKIDGYEKEPEKGERCTICYEDRLRKTAQTAKKLKFNFFTSTLTVSPHKDAKRVSKIGNRLEKEYGVLFLDKDFKTNGGFEKACKLSKKLELYRQNYCGCEFSIRK